MREKVEIDISLPDIHPVIARARTPGPEFYLNEKIHAQIIEKVFARSWQVIPHFESSDKHRYIPFAFCPQLIDEPLLLARDEIGNTHCLSNVCTHRGNILVSNPTSNRVLTCKYHGRCFHSDGKFKSTPGFEGVENFPGLADDLKTFPLESLGPLLFTSLDPGYPFERLIRPIKERLGWLPLDKLVFQPDDSRDYHLAANWMLYVDNYLEGFHIPFVHPGLNAALQKGEYHYELFELSNLQSGTAKEGEPCFNIPVGQPDSGKAMYAYYFWVFPNLMFNFYPWGLSLNIVQPLGLNTTRIRFLTFTFPGATSDLSDHKIHQTEMEDEEVVLSVQKGMTSRFYAGGRYSVEMEKCVHHFHRMLVSHLKQAGSN